MPIPGEQGEPSARGWAGGAGAAPGGSLGDVLGVWGQGSLLGGSRESRDVGGRMSLLTSCCFTERAPAPHRLLEVEEPAWGL